MLWPVLILAACVLVLVIVVAIAVYQFYGIRTMERAMKEAWGGIDSYEGDNARFRLVSDDTLGTPPSAEEFESGGAQYSAATSLVLADHVARVQLAANAGEKRPADPPGGGATLAALFYPFDSQGREQADGPVFGAAWAYGNGTMVVAFRATVTDYEKRLDMKTHQEVVDGGALVHHGFEHVYEHYRVALQRAIDSVRPRLVLFTGHSLGAAVATLGAYRLAHIEGAPALGGYVYGSPRVGDPRFAQRFAELQEAGRVNVWRESNRADFITELPLAVTPNMNNVGEATHYEHVGRPRVFNENHGALKHNHLLSVYIQNVRDVGAAAAANDTS
jgi:triacylglycerol lipase